MKGLKKIVSLILILTILISFSQLFFVNHKSYALEATYTQYVKSGSAENKCLRNTIYKNTLIDPASLCYVGHYGDANYYCASAKMVNYYLDPRNFLKETQIFQFLDLTETGSVTRNDVVIAVQGTYLEPYVDAIISAAASVGISPLTIISTISGGFVRNFLS